MWPRAESPEQEWALLGVSPPRDWPGEFAESERRGRKSGFRDGPLENAAGGHDEVTRGRLRSIGPIKLQQQRLDAIGVNRLFESRPRENCKAAILRSNQGNGIDLVLSELRR